MTIAVELPERDAALISERERLELRLDPALGAGNYLHLAHRTNPRLDVPVLFCDRAYRALDGTEHEQLTIAGLKAEVDALAAWYLSLGVARMDPVAVYLDDGVEYLLHYTALTAVGAVPLVINGAMAPEIASALIERMEAVGLFTDATHEAALSIDLRFVATAERAHPVEDELPAWYPFTHDDGDPIMITHTSGTTGVPKGVVLRHGGFFHGIRHLLGLATAPGTERILSSLPSSHNSAIAYAMHAVLNGFQMMIVSDRGGEHVLGLIERFTPGTVISFPHTYVQMVEADMDAFDLESVSLWLCSGDGSHQPHIEELVRHGHHYRGENYVEGSQYVDSLGSSEMGHTLFRNVHTTRTDNYDRCIGMPQTWVEATVLDPDGNELGPDQVGLLGVRAPSVTEGYWNDSANTYRSRLRGFWLTGDLAFRDERGAFYHVDRSVDSITTTDGPLYSLQTEELLLKRLRDIDDCVVIGIPDGDGHEAPVCLARSKTAAADLLARANEVQGELGRPRLRALRVVDADDIPVGVTGKVLKAQLRRRYPKLEEFAPGDGDTTTALDG
jgi:3-aminoavenalumate diazotase